MSQRVAPDEKGGGGQLREAGRHLVLHEHEVLLLAADLDGKVVGDALQDALQPPLQLLHRAAHALLHLRPPSPLATIISSI